MKSRLAMGMAIGICVVALVSAVLFVSTASAVAAQDDSEAVQLYSARCASCHGSDGMGKTPVGQRISLPDLGGEQVQKQSDAQILELVSDGHGRMPGHEESLTSGQMKKIVAHVRGLARKE